MEVHHAGYKSTMFSPGHRMSFLPSHKSIFVKVLSVHLRKAVLSLRRFRRYHRIVGLVVALLVFVSALTGILLALKKEVDVLQPPTVKGSSKDLAEWLPVQQLHDLAWVGLVAAQPDQADNGVDRLDLRPSKGMAKVIFEEGNWEVQIDASTGDILSVAKRHSDWIEALHDGSIIADWFKLLSMNVLGWGLLVMLFSGLWLWYGPRVVRRLKK